MAPSSQAPQQVYNFRAVDVLGRHINLTDYRKGYTLLVFLRYAGCPWCNLAIHRLTLEYARLQELHCDVIAFVQSDKAHVQQNIFERHDPAPQFPIIADKAMKYYKQYEVSSSVAGSVGLIKQIPYWLQAVHKLGFSQRHMDGSFFLVPAWFLINNRTHEIVRSERGASFYNHETFVSLYESLLFKD